jgi:hypothetical protein
MGISERHYRRLEAGQVTARAVHYRLLRLAGGDLEALAPSWRGCRLDRDGGLWTDDYPTPLTLADVRAIPWREAQIRAQGARLRELERQRRPQGAPSSRAAVGGI